MDNQPDRVTRFIVAASNIVFIGYPLRTSLGVLVGLAFSALAKLFSPLLSNLSPVIDFSKISEWEYIVLGVVLLHLRTIRFYLFQKGSMLGENEEKAFALIRRAKANHVPQRRIQQMYLELCEKVLANTNLTPAAKPETSKKVESPPDQNWPAGRR